MSQSIKMHKCVSVLCLIFGLFLILLTKDKASAQELKPPAVDFSRHSVVRPKLHHTREKRELRTSRNTDGLHHAEVTVTVEVDGEEYVLELRLNEDLIPDNHIVRYHKNGEMVHHKPSREELDLCHYYGHIRGRPESWVAVSTCRGLSGIMFDGKSLRYIQPAKDGDIQSEHYVYDYSDLHPTEHKCGYNDTFNIRYEKQTPNHPNRYKRSPDDMLVRGPYNSNRLSRYVELVLVADNGEYKANGENLDTVHHQLKDVANIINAVYTPLNIFISLVGVVVWTEHDEINLEENGDHTLTKFLEYREKLLLTMPNDNAQLLTRTKFDSGVVGKALKGPICTYKYSGGVATNHSEVIGLVATTIAHEMGHNFGMEHDNADDCKCPDEKCIMSPSSTSVMPLHWSSCSLESLALAFARGMDYCLRNKPRRLFASPTCGNGFVEAGEQCDCGLREAGARERCEACCRPDACLLRHNASCATGHCCDLQTCRPMSAGTVCRSANQECDLPEYCTGQSEYCPDDVFKMDAIPCGEGQAFCSEGACRSHTSQCQLLWGQTGHRSHDLCYSRFNINGSTTGNCGYSRTTQAFRRCQPQHAACGLLHCRYLNEQLEFGLESVSQLSHTFININGDIQPCRTATIDLGLSQPDPGMVPNGAKCGDNKMCLNQTCVDILWMHSIIENMPSSVCPSDCSGHGVCNSLGHCHCDSGFSPPLCQLPGPGGSIDSGPATDPTVQRNFMVAMYIIFLGIIPSILIILLLFYYSKHNVMFWWKRPRKSTQSPKKNSLQRRLSKGASKFAASFQSSHPPAPPTHVHTIPSPDDMSSSLLRSDTDHSPSGTANPSVNFFGNFKGFSLTPIESQQPNNTAVTTIANNENHNTVSNKSAKITPVHRSSSNSQSIISQSVLKPVLRAAPPLPVVPPTAKANSPNASPTIKRNNSSIQDRMKALINNEKTESMTPVASKTPSPRPVISSPILEASTCTAKELISPLQGFKTLVPARTAPTIPTESIELPKRPISMHENVLNKPLPEEPKKGISLNRIASFLKQEKPKEKERRPVERSHSLPKNPAHQVKIPKTVDKVALRNLQISNPILQKEIDLPVNTVPVISDTEDGDDKPFVSRTQSMRGPAATPKPTLQSFGSMRQPSGVSRPLSTFGRPTAPPPPLPNQTKIDSNSNTSFYQNPKPLDIKSIDYVDCIEEKQAPLAHIDEESGDNIYAIIEESPEKPKPLPGFAPPIKTTPQAPPEGYNTPRQVTSNSGSTESMGLLGEIVNEIQNRNFDSIYSASTLKKKKVLKDKDTKEESNRDSTYANADDYKTPESVYSNSGAKSSASTTSSGYLHPSAVNVPTYFNNKPAIEQSTIDQQNESIDKAPPSPTMKVTNSKIPTFTRQVTPPGLRTTTFRNVPSSPKNTPKSVTHPINSNSPDLVSSCSVSDTNNVKPPDVINNNKESDVSKVVNKSNNLVKPCDRPPLRPTPNVDKKTTPSPTVKPVNVNISTKPSEKVTPLNRISSKVDSNVKSIADNINKNKPKVVPKPSSISIQKTEANVTKPTTTKLTSRPSNVASLQQKFENRKSVGRQPSQKK